MFTLLNPLPYEKKMGMKQEGTLLSRHMYTGIRDLVQLINGVKVVKTANSIL